MCDSNKHVSYRRYLASATVIGWDVYLFGGFATFDVHPRSTSELWKLSKTGEASFIWSQITTDQSASPSPRGGYNSWGLDNKVYIFAGCGSSPDGYLHNDKNFQLISDQGWYNNQLFNYHVDSQQWEMLKCKGDPPAPRAYAAVAVTGNSVWLHGGYINEQAFGDLYEFSIKEQTWTRIIVDSMEPRRQYAHTLTAMSNDRLMLQSGLPPPKDVRHIYLIALN